MSVDRPTPISEAEFIRLEHRVDELVRAYERLQMENEELRMQQQRLLTERAGLLQKNEQARERVEAIITRLRSMERA